jgi:choline dehydrogenase-like flavoprotein
MISDLAQGSPGTRDTDVCIVGAGPVGISLALLLARRGIKVMLLESGATGTDVAAQALNEGTITGHMHRGSTAGRFRGIGGTSRRWGGQLLAFEPVNFERREWVPDSGWPFARTELECHYRTALELEGMAGSIEDDSVLRAKVGHVELPQPNLELRFSRWCPEPDFSVLHGAELKSSREIDCWVHATVGEFAVDGERVIAVHARSGAHSMEVRARHFVVAVGAIETARLLLQPLPDGSQPPWIRLGCPVGHFFQDHLALECADVAPRRSEDLHQLLDMLYVGRFRYQPRLHLAAHVQREQRCLAAGGILVFRSHLAQFAAATRTAVKSFLRDPGARTFWTAARASLGSGTFVPRQAWRLLRHRRAYNPSDSGVRLLCFVEQMPRSASRISLAEERDALGMRRVRIDWRLGVEELTAARAFSREVARAFESSGIARVLIEPALEALDPAFLHTGWDNYHHMGTARIGASPAQGVLDADLRILGTSNAFACGCAAFPTGGFENPTHTAIALAARLAQHLSCRSP